VGHPVLSRGAEALVGTAYRVYQPSDVSSHSLEKRSAANFFICSCGGSVLVDFSQRDWPTASEMKAVANATPKAAIGKQHFAQKLLHM
jgi:hypothetical protein